MAKEVDSKLVVLSSDVLGDVKVTDDVVAVIAGYAAMEVEGVAYMASDITAELLSKVGMGSLRKDVKVAIEENQVRVDMAIVIDYGYAIPNTSALVQDRVKASIESMTGLEVVDVTIRIAGVRLGKAEEEM